MAPGFGTQELPHKVHDPNTGKPRAKVHGEERPDGKYLLSTPPSLSAEEVALGYKQLSEVERAFRTLKHTLDLRPLYHRLPDRILAHVLLCGLALSWCG
jgi:transposase